MIPNRFVAVCLSFILLGGSVMAQSKPYAIAIHGGAGQLPPNDEWRTERQRVLTEALTHGRDLLKQGGTSLDAVEAVVRILEDSPWFNAGRGAVLNAEGTHELDASIMDGRDRSAGAVGAVTTVKNPITLARRVMTDSPHVLLVTGGAEQFADRYQQDPMIERVTNDYFTTDYQRQSLERARKKAGAKDSVSTGTVGCVALDQSGNLAAATSTGGLTNKRFGRIGDSPIIGAGTYADNRTCAVSCTGVGEDFIRHSVAFDISARVAYRGDSLKHAVQQILDDKTDQVRGGIIAVSKDAEIVIAFNTAGMSRAAANSTGRFDVHVAE